MKILKDLKGPGLKEIFLSGGLVLGASVIVAIIIAALDTWFMSLVDMFV